MKLHRGTQVTCWETLEWAKMESLLRLNLENFPDARQGYYQRESGWTAIDGAKEMSLASGIKFHPPPPSRSVSLFFPSSSTAFIFIPLSWRELARARLSAASSARSRCPSVSSKLAILPRNFARASLYFPDSDVSPRAAIDIVWRNFKRCSREKSPLRARAWDSRDKGKRDATVFPLIADHA